MGALHCIVLFSEEKYPLKRIDKKQYRITYSLRFYFGFFSISFVFLYSVFSIITYNKYRLCRRLVQMESFFTGGGQKFFPHNLFCRIVWEFQVMHTSIHWRIGAVAGINFSDNGQTRIEVGQTAWKKWNVIISKEILCPVHLLTQTEKWDNLRGPIIEKKTFLAGTIAGLIVGPI